MTTTSATETKTAGLELKADEPGAFVVRFATKRDADGELIIDRDGDVYADDAVGVQPVVIGCHNHGSCAGPAGRGMTQETASEILAVGRLDLSTPHGRDEYATWKALGDRAQFSYVYRVRDFDHIEVRGRRVRRLKSLEVISVDLVQNPAGIGTGIVSLKAACACGCEGGSGCLEAVATRGQLLLQKLRYADTMRELSRPKEDPYPFAYKQGGAPWADSRVAALFTVAMLAAGHDELRPEVKFFTSAPRGEQADFKTPFAVRGRFDPKQPDVLWVAADLEPWQAAQVAAHEFGHRVRPYRGEAAADELAHEFMAAFASEDDLVAAAWRWRHSQGG